MTEEKLVEFTANLCNLLKIQRRLARGLEPIAFRICVEGDGKGITSHLRDRVSPGKLGAIIALATRGNLSSSWRHTSSEKCVSGKADEYPCNRPDYDGHMHLAILARPVLYAMMYDIFVTEDTILRGNGAPFDPPVLLRRYVHEKRLSRQFA